MQAAGSKIAYKAPMSKDQQDGGSGVPEGGEQEQVLADKPVGRRLQRFRLDLIPIFRSKRVAEQIRGESIEWERERGGEEAVWRRRVLYSGGVAVALCLLAGTIWLSLIEGEREGRGAAAVVVPESSERLLQAEVEAVKRAVSKFLGANTLDEKLSWVVPSAGIEGKMGEYYERHPARAQAVFDFSVIALKVSVAGNFYVVQAVTTDDEPLNFVVVPGDAGARVAWEAHVGYCEMDWGRYLQLRPEQVQEMRVYVEPATFYRAPFDDRAEYLSIEISRPGSSERLRAYVSRTGTARIGEMAEVLLSGRPEPVVVRLMFPPGQGDAGDPVALVDSFVQRGWFVPGGED